MSAPAEQETKKVDFRERCSVAANLHAEEASKWRRLLDHYPDRPDFADEAADETQRSQDMTALASALDALETAVKGCGKKLDIDRDPPRVHCGIRGHRRRTPYCTTCRDAIDAAISTLTGASRP